MPVFASGQAIVVTPGARDATPAGEAVLVAFFPAQGSPSIPAGTSLWTRTDRNSSPIPHRVISVSPQPIGPQEAERHFGRHVLTSGVINQPATVAIAEWAPAGQELPASAYAGSVFAAEIQIGTRKIASLLPVIGQWFGEQS